MLPLYVAWGVTGVRDMNGALDNLRRWQHNALKPNAHFASAREARRRGLVFAGHVFPPVTPLQASDSGQRSEEHLSGFPNECTSEDSTAFAAALPLQRFLLGACTRELQAPLYARIAANGTWITPTLTVQTPLAELLPAAPPGSETASYYSDSLTAFMKIVMPLPPNVPDAARVAGRALMAKRIAMVGN